VITSPGTPCYSTAFLFYIINRYGSVYRQVQSAGGASLQSKLDVARDEVEDCVAKVEQTRVQLSVCLSVCLSLYGCTWTVTGIAGKPRYPWVFRRVNGSNVAVIVWGWN